MADHPQGTFKTRWAWNLSTDDDQVVWIGQIQQGHAVPSWISYEHGHSAEASSVTLDGLSHPDVTSEELCAAIWPVVDEYLREAERPTTPPHPRSP